MTEMLFEVTIVAEGEVRDKDGNLLSTTEARTEKVLLTADQLREAGIEPPTEPTDYKLTQEGQS